MTVFDVVDAAGKARNVSRANPVPIVAVAPSDVQKHTSVGSVTSAAALLIPARASRTMLAIANNGAEAIYLGDNAAVLITTGFPVAPGVVFSDDSSHDAYYAICATGPVDVRIIRVE